MITLRELFVEAWKDGYEWEPVANPEQRAEDFLGSETASQLGVLPDMILLDEGIWVWVVRSIIAKEKRLVPVDKNHYVFAVPHDWVENGEDMEKLKDDISKVYMSMSGIKPGEISPNDPAFN